jgi:hypothetical protein
MVYENPGVYFRELYPNYRRAAQICELVYANIDRLYEPKHDGGSSVASFITMGGDEDIIKCRCLLGYYKPTGGDSAGALEEFNQLLKRNSITPNDFSGGELSDAEHFYTSAVMTMVPILGLFATPTAIFLWDYELPLLTSYYKVIDKWSEYTLKEHFENFANRMRYDVKQLTGPDLAGHRYGISVTYINSAKWYFK